MFFAKRLSFLLQSGLPILESIKLIKNQYKSKYEIQIFENIIFDMSNGQSLSISLKKFQTKFGIFSINIIHAGEQSGTLVLNLSYLADELRKKQILKKKIWGALLYPLIVTIATFGITTFLAIYIFPKIIPIFASLNAELPLSTRIVMWLTILIKNHWILILFCLMSVILILILLIRKNKKVRFIYHKMILRIPIFGKIFRDYNLTNSTRILGLLLKGGISLSESILIVAKSNENLEYQKIFNTCFSNILKGKTLADSLKKQTDIFPEMITQMIAVGEQSGNLPETLMYLSEFYEQEFDEKTKNLSSTIEPILMIIMGIMVGFIAISVITPIYEITNSIKK